MRMFQSSDLDYDENDKEGERGEGGRDCWLKVINNLQKILIIKSRNDKTPYKKSSEDLEA